VSQACPLFLVIPGASSTPLSPLSSARSRDRAPSSNRFRIAAYLDPQVGLQGTWERDTRSPKSHFQKCEWRPHTSLEVGLRQIMKCSTTLPFLSFIILIVFFFQNSSPL
jgi:hypothetical protein